MAMLLLVQTAVELGLWLRWVRHCPVQRAHRGWQWRGAPLALRQLLLRLVLSQLSGSRDLIGDQIRVTSLVRLCSCICQVPERKRLGRCGRSISIVLLHEVDHRFGCTGCQTILQSVTHLRCDNVMG